MVASIAGYRFEGLFFSPDDILECSGLLVAMTADHHRHGKALVDIVSSDDLRASAAQLVGGSKTQAQVVPLLFAVRYCPRAQRASLEAIFRRDIEGLGYLAGQRWYFQQLAPAERRSSMVSMLEFALLADGRVGLVPIRRPCGMGFPITVTSAQLSGMSPVATMRPGPLSVQ